MSAGAAFDAAARDYDRSTLEAKLGRLRDAGFHDVRRAYRSGMFAVCAGVR